MQAALRGQRDRMSFRLAQVQRTNFIRIVAKL